MRPLLIDLMKEHLNGLERQGRDQGIRIDLSWVLKELGLNELMG
jgi:hypothetical protein